MKDTAKSTQIPGRHTSAIDLNRAGTGLMEIVSEPDMRFVRSYRPQSLDNSALFVVLPRKLVIM